MLSFDDENEDDLLRLITKGIEIRPDRKDGKTFWDDFLSVLTANPEVTAKLLNIRKESISTWRSKINKLLPRVKEATKEKHRKNTMLST